MVRRMINSTQVVQDVKSGKTVQEISRHHGISWDELDDLFSTLVSRGLLQEKDLPKKPASLLRSRTIPSVRCPNCRSLQIKGDKVCIDCGSRLPNDSVGQNSDSNQKALKNSNRPVDPVIGNIWTCRHVEIHNRRSTTNAHGAA